MDTDREIITQSAQETANLGQELANSLREQGKGGKARIICLYGELGSGKTTFAQGVAKGVGIKSRLLSPTFIIVRRYQLSQPSRFLYHLDLYRLQKEEELSGLGLSEILATSKAYILVEWAEKLGRFLPSKRIDIHFRINNDGSHLVKIEHHGEFR